MSKTKQNTKIGIFKNVQTLTVCAMLTAMSVAIGIFCKNFLDFGGGLFRITFENLPILLSGIMFGPIVGGAVGLCTDVVSYLLSGQIYPMNLIVTFGAVMVGVVSGFFGSSTSTSAFMKKEALLAQRVLFSTMATPPWLQVGLPPLPSRVRVVAAS